MYFTHFFSMTRHKHIEQQKNNTFSHLHFTTDFRCPTRTSNRSPTYDPAACCKLPEEGALLCQCTNLQHEISQMMLQALGAGWGDVGVGSYLQDHPRTCKCLATPMYKPWNGHLEREQPYLGHLLSMVIHHLLTGMILQVGDVS